MKKLKITSSTFNIYLLFNDKIIINLQINDFFIADIIEFIKIKS